jgi:hypothetical protein
VVCDWIERDTGCWRGFQRGVRRVKFVFYNEDYFNSICDEFRGGGHDGSVGEQSPWAGDQLSGVVDICKGRDSCKEL